jgi:hypothetical protein
MAYVITSRCQSNCLQDCVKTCPIDAPFRDEEVPVDDEGDIQQNADFFAA